MAAKEICLALYQGDKPAGEALWKAVVFQCSGVERESIKVASTVAECYTRAQRGSVEKRVLRACLSSLRRNTELSSLTGEHPDFSMAANSYARGRTDLDALRCGELLTSNRRTIQLFEPQVIEELVAKILQADNESFLSWGTKSVRLNGNAFVIPAIMCQKLRAVRYGEYVVAAEALL